MAVGLIFYFAYGRHKSTVALAEADRLAVQTTAGKLILRQAQDDSTRRLRGHDEQRNALVGRAAVGLFSGECDGLIGAR